MIETLEQVGNEDTTAVTILPPENRAQIATVSKMLLPAISLSESEQRYGMFVDFVKSQLKEGIDYGTIPGTGDKKTLLKPGAEKLCTFFGLRPIFKLIKEEEDWMGYTHDGEPFFQYVYACELWRDHLLVVSSEASCNSWEKKYRYRQMQLSCPECGKASVFKDKKGDGWYCWTKKEGCGAQFSGNDARIKNQKVGRVANEDIFDQVNTIRKMAEKRAFVNSVIVAVNASEFFTQDLEDLTGWSPETDNQTQTPSRNDIVFPRDPIAKSVNDLVTMKQLQMIRAMSRELGLNHDEECQAVLGCNTDDLSKRAASSLIEHLKRLAEESALSNFRTTSQPQDKEPQAQNVVDIQAVQQRETAKQEQPKKQESSREQTQPNQQQQQDKATATRDKRGQGIAAMGLVSRDGDRFKVLTPGLRGRQVTYEVWKDTKGKVRCSCLEFEEKVNEDSSYRCEHIYAVKHYVVSVQKASTNTAPVNENQPADDKTDEIIRLTTAANVNAEDEAQNLFCADVSELDDAQKDDLIKHLRNIHNEQSNSDTRWKCTPETRQRYENALNEISSRPNALTKEEILKKLREQYGAGAPESLSEAEADNVVKSFQTYLSQLDEELKAEKELQGKQGNQGNNRGNANRK